MGAAGGHGLSTQAVFFLAHEWKPSLAMRFERLHRELQGVAECFALVQRGAGDVPAKWAHVLGKHGLAHALRVFDAPALPAVLGFPFYGDDQVMGNTHYPLMAQARTGTWDFCWQVESDLELRGHWGELLGTLGTSDADLLVSHKHRYGQWPKWRWWRSLHPPADVHCPAADRLKGFFPLSRFSKRAWPILEEAHRAGWRGHFEVLVPTVLARKGLKVKDLRSVLHCYEGMLQNPARDAAQLSTLRWRPPVTAEEFAQRGRGSLVFHPVKDDWAFDGRNVRAWPRNPEPAA